MANYKLGENAKLYYSATLEADFTPSVSATIAAEVRNVKVGAKSDTPEYTTRNNGGVKQYATSLKDLSISFEIKIPATIDADAAYTAIRDAWKNGTEIALYALSDLKTVPGAEGPTGNFVIADMTRDEGNGNVLFATVEAKPSSFNTWYVVPAS